ncbi:Hypothetical protein CpE19_2073 [Corynebacterium pseudotuberculosis]|nr:Hypothetical protein CpE19_2073 [Corynebacterium pseudotuberculosis]
MGYSFPQVCVQDVLLRRPAWIGGKCRVAGQSKEYIRRLTSARFCVRISIEVAKQHCDHACFSSLSTPCVGGGRIPCC